MSLTCAQPWRPSVEQHCKQNDECFRVFESDLIAEAHPLCSFFFFAPAHLSQTSKIRRHHTPVFSDEDYSPANIASRFSKYLEGAEGFSEAYMSMIPNVNQFLRPVLDHIVQKRTPFIVHCTAGKDRTGVACALLQMICGVDEETITWEYELTHKCLASKLLTHMVAQRCFEKGQTGTNCILLYELADS